MTHYLLGTVGVPLACFFHVGFGAFLFSLDFPFYSSCFCSCSHFVVSGSFRSCFSPLTEVFSLLCFANRSSPILDTFQYYFGWFSWIVKLLILFTFIEMETWIGWYVFYFVIFHISTVWCKVRLELYLQVFSFKLISIFFSLFICFRRYFHFVVPKSFHSSLSSLMKSWSCISVLPFANISFSFWIHSITISLQIYMISWILFSVPRHILDQRQYLLNNNIEQWHNDSSIHVVTLLGFLSSVAIINKKNVV